MRTSGCHSRYSHQRKPIQRSFFKFVHFFLSQWNLKTNLRNYIALVSQYNDHWTEWFDVSHKIKLIRARQKLREEHGFSPNQHPQNKPGFHSMNQNAQFEEKQRFEKQQFEHQTDEQFINTLSQQAN
ncbi:hypothetical protein HMI54_005379 [Coelomomyces lativittatus]|nr:hypothetical protein HMI54_005379 [Coelomomyces lativittatus]